MAINSVTNTTGTKGTTATTDTKAAAEKTSIDKDAFLKLLVAQMAHQDPTQPQDPTAFVQQLSQFAMVEQSISQSSKLDTLATEMTGLSNNEATNLVGQNVTLQQDKGTVTGKVTQVTFDQGFPQLKLESGETASISKLVSVGGKVQ